MRLTRKDLKDLRELDVLINLCRVRDDISCIGDMVAILNKLMLRHCAWVVPPPSHENISGQQTDIQRVRDEVVATLRDIFDNYKCSDN